MIALFINALTVFGIVLCLAIIMLALNLWRRSHNPLLILAGLYSLLGTVTFSVVLYLRPLPAGGFPSVLVGVLIWGFIIVGLLFLFMALVVNRWFPFRWRGRA